MKIKELKYVQEKYGKFLMIYEQGIKAYVPFYKVGIIAVSTNTAHVTVNCIKV